MSEALPTLKEHLSMKEVKETRLKARVKAAVKKPVKPPKRKRLPKHICRLPMAEMMKRLEKTDDHDLLNGYPKCADCRYTASRIVLRRKCTSGFITLYDMSEINMKELNVSIRKDMPTHTDLLTKPLSALGAYYDSLDESVTHLPLIPDKSNTRR